ncbi:type II toxin-antitoxin system VapC family toxin [Hoeflea poritis]|uniref:Ribonuclease VapC n=1 Tax=Hoeflea poritis TaxID=2993659 RepID=A0ABT4VMH0_9HYPH|nr:type II toxin-antitoxin system VapC family toxin [Hoeflea poritis]MDA4845912.1 type II toxin-antitoxin system VapC family toxin [Hoeflea poritis]
MIVLDTNVISEAMRPSPEPAVQNWLNEQTAQTLYMPSIVLAELLFGIAALPAGKRKNRLADALNGITDLFEKRILPFDADCAKTYADLMARARSQGSAVSAADGYIAATAAANDMTVATRDSRPFNAVGVPVINPWE